MSSQLISDSIKLLSSDLQSVLRCAILTLYLKLTVIFDMTVRSTSDWQKLIKIAFYVILMFIQAHSTNVNPRKTNEIHKNNTEF